LGYALKKVIKLLAVVVGLFFVGLVYLQYQQIFSLNWTKVQILSENAVESLANVTGHIAGIESTSGGDHALMLALSCLAIPLTGSMSVGFAIGFMKG
jgi:uncharacterized membrane protein (Fun14 family)